MNVNKVLIGVSIVILQIPLWMILSPSINVISKLPFILLFPMTGIGVLMIINGSTPPFVKKN